MQILFVSNGAGEDGIAANVAESLRELVPGVSCLGFPLLGSGKAYRNRGIDVVNVAEMPPSGGFMRSLVSVAKDLAGGVIRQHYQNRIKLRERHAHTHAIVAVGDVYCLGIAAKGFNGPIVFMPTAKSDRFMPHTGLEVGIMKRIANVVVPRDEDTAAGLRAQGVDAIYCGNPMMDKLMVGHSLTGVLDGNDKDVVALIPGSRSEAILNLARQLDVVVALCSQGFQANFVVAKAPTLSVSAIKEGLESTAWHVAQDGGRVSLVHSKTAVKVLMSEAFVDVINAARWCIGMAGTANEQAAHYGRFVYTFVGTGPQSTEKRLREQEQLMGRERICFLDARGSAELAARLLADYKQRGMGELSPIGYETDASTAVAQLIAQRADLL
ncbi:MAG: hypothetical protein O3A01_00430 [bacterium]|nr:hypothetical protein [bacterium]